MTAGLNCLGMIDVACYVSSAQVLASRGASHSYLPHFHGLVWGISERELERRCAFIRLKMKTFFKYATSAKFRRVEPGDLGQVLWYVIKAPQKQYQLWRQQDNHIRQWKRKINGVNSVRIYAEMRDVTLDKLTVANGAGKKLLARTLADLQHRSSCADKEGSLPDPEWFQDRPPAVKRTGQIISLDELLSLLDSGVLGGGRNQGRRHPDVPGGFPRSRDLGCSPCTVTRANPPC
jgi:hypothetical protein